MGERRARVARTTEEAEVKVFLDLDGTGTSAVQTGSPFLDHMLDLLARYGGFNLQVHGQAFEADPSELMEDVGFCMGLAFEKALGEKAGITRLGHSCAPVDDRLARAVVEISGQPCLVYRSDARGPGQGDSDSIGIEKFWQAFVAQARLILHLELLYGDAGLPAHEAVFKAAARALSEAAKPKKNP
jgi:imidazoleglycerol-phosphate dehydratase